MKRMSTRLFRSTFAGLERRQQPVHGLAQVLGAFLPFRDDFGQLRRALKSSWQEWTTGEIEEADWMLTGADVAAVWPGRRPPWLRVSSRRLGHVILPTEACFGVSCCARLAVIS
jgi:hypothetical protein